MVSLVFIENMSTGDPKGPFLIEIPPLVLWDFCRVMDALSDLDWTRFASVVLEDQTAVRLAERRERRTEYVMNQWGNRNGRVSELINLLEHLQLLRPRDVILASGVSSLKPYTPAAPPPPPPPLPPPPPAVAAQLPPPRLEVSQFSPPPKPPKPQITSSNACELSTMSTRVHEGGGRQLPRPAPPPSSLLSDHHPAPQPSAAEALCSSGVMCWSHEEVCVGTEGFSHSLQVGEGGFGVVYKATLKKTVYAVKRLKQDCLLDWSLLKESFQTEVEKLSKYRHPNVIELLGFSEGPGSLCLIYSYMDKRSLEHQLHNECAFLSWSQRVSVVKGASTALQFLHCPPKGHTPLIHGDVKSSNILLDCHMTAKLGDFGLAQFVSQGSSGRSVSQTTSVGQTATIRGTLAYLPDEYVRDGKLGTAVDVYSFGVVLLEVLTGRRALDKDKKSGEKYLKDLVDEVEDSPAGSSEAAWRKQLDHQLIAGGVSETAGCMEMAALACRCLDRNRKRRPAMTKVFDKLQDIHNMVRKRDSSSCQSLPRPILPKDSSLESISQGMSKLGPLEDTYQPSYSSQSSSSSSSFSSLASAHPLHSFSSLSSTSSSLPVSPSSFVCPCETDESRGFSQYDLRSQVRANGTSSRSLSPSTRDQDLAATRPSGSPLSQPSVPTEDQYNFPPQPSNTIWRSSLTGAPVGSDTSAHNTAGAPESVSPVRSLQSLFPRPSVVMNPIKQHFLHKKVLYEEGRIQTPELLSSDDIYGGTTSAEFRGPEESDELDYLPAKHQ